MGNHDDHVEPDDRGLRLIRVFFFVVCFGTCDGFFSGFVHWFAMSSVDAFCFTMILDEFFYLIGHEATKEDDGRWKTWWSLFEGTVI